MRRPIREGAVLPAKQYRVSSLEQYLRCGTSLAMSPKEPATVEQLEQLADLYGVVFRIHPKGNGRPHAEEVFAFYKPGATEQDFREGALKRRHPMKLFGFYASSPIDRYIDRLKRRDW